MCSLQLFSALKESVYYYLKSEAECKFITSIWPDKPQTVSYLLTSYLGLRHQSLEPSDWSVGVTTDINSSHLPASLPPTQRPDQN